MRMRRIGILGVLLFALSALAPSAQADTVVCVWDQTWVELGWQFGGGGFYYYYPACYLIIDVPANDPGGGVPNCCPLGGPPGSSVILPSVRITSIDTTDPQEVMLSADVTNSDGFPAVVVELQVGGTSYDSSPFVGSGNYLLHMPSPGYFGDGLTTILVRACSATEQCGTSTAMMSRSTPGALSTSATMGVTWYQPEKNGPVAESANYEHQLLQTYTLTSFSVSETGLNTSRQLRSSTIVVTQNQADPEPLWRMQRPAAP